MTAFVPLFIDGNPIRMSIVHILMAGVCIGPRNHVRGSRARTTALLAALGLLVISAQLQAQAQAQAPAPANPALLRALNAVPAVNDLSPGWVTALDLPLIGGVGTIR